MLSKAEQAVFDQVQFNTLLSSELSADAYQDLIILHCLKRGDKPAVIAEKMGVSLTHITLTKQKFLNYGIEAVLSDLVAKMREEQKRDVFIDKLLTQQHRAIENGQFEILLRDVSSLRSKIFGTIDNQHINKQSMRKEGYVRVILPLEDYNEFMQWQATQHG